MINIEHSDRMLNQSSNIVYLEVNPEYNASSFLMTGPTTLEQFKFQSSMEVSDSTPRSIEEAISFE